jgi:hypothetical protein
MSKLSLAMKLLDILQQDFYKELPKSMGLFGLAACKDMWQKEPGAFLKYAEETRGLTPHEAHLLIALFRAESLGDEFKKQVPTENEARLALLYFGVGLNVGMCDQHIAVKLQKQLDNYNRKKLRAKTHRAKSHFTLVMEYLFKLCISNGKTELIAPGNPDEFMMFIQRSIREGKGQDKNVAQRIDKVGLSEVNPAKGYIKMHENFGRPKPREGIDPLTYPRVEVQKELSRLRKKYSQSVK